MSFAKVNADFSVSPQLTASSVQAAAQAGFRTLINNRPDHEAPDQLTSAQVAALCQSHGLGYVYAPTTTPTALPDVARMGAALAQAQGPVLAFCRSGTRSITLWAMVQAQAGKGPEHLIEAAKGAGYDLSGLAKVFSAAQPDGNHTTGDAILG